MSAVLEPQAPAAIEVVNEISTSLQTVQASVTNFDKIKAGIAMIEADHPKDLVVDCTTPAGMRQAIAGRAAWRDPRIAVEKARKAAKAPVLELGRAIDRFAGSLEDTLRIGEDNYDGQIEAHKTKVEAEKERQRLANVARQQAHRDGIAKIRSYADAARLPGMTAERLLKGLSALEAMVIDPAAWEEFATEAAHVLAETTAAVKAEHAALVEREAEAARLAQQAKEQAERQAELDRIAAEQKAQADALAAQQAEIARQAEALAEQQRAAAAAEAQRLQDEQDREDARRRAIALEAQAALPAAPIPMQPAEPMNQPLAMPDAIPVGEVVESVEPAAAPVLTDDGKRWKLGDITALFGVGLTSERVRGLGIEPVAVEGRSMLFTTLQVVELRAALVAHLMSLEIEYPA